MNMQFVLCMVFVICSALIAECTDVKQCQGGHTKKLNSTDVSVTNCHKGVCKLRRKTDVDVIIKFKPEKDLKDLITTVSADVLGVQLPFIGVDGTSACDHVYLEDGVTKTKCPLAADQTYVYNKSFRVLEIYPKLNVVVRWSLTTRNRDVVCFEIPAKII